MSERSAGGYHVVLTADRTLMANYRVLFEGMLSSSQTTVTPALLMRGLLARPLRVDGGHSPKATLGLRRVESALLAGGFSRDEVAVTTPESLEPAIGKATRIVGVSTGDPLGLGMNSSTTEGIAGGTPYPAKWFATLMKRLGKLRRTSGFKVIVGGPGAWQLAQDADARKRLGIDHVFVGYSEGEAAALFRRIADGETVSEVITAKRGRTTDIPPIRGATVMGVVEISRGCGLGCRFCTLASEPMVHLSPDAVVADVRTNTEAGVRDVSLASEDLFRYGSPGGMAANPPALIGLLRKLRAETNARMMQPDHANIASAAGFSDAQLKEVHDLLAADSPARPVWLNVGVETASGTLLQKNGGAAKMRPAGPEGWGEFCLEQVKRLSSAGFLPLVSLVLGLPGETEDDVAATLDWVNKLGETRAAVVPLFMAPVAAGERGFTTRDMTRTHWRLFRRAYDYSFKWIPHAFWNDQTRAGVPMARRLVLQIFGRLNIPYWKMMFVLRSGRVRA